MLSWGPPYFLGGALIHPDSRHSQGAHSRLGTVFWRRGWGMGTRRGSPHGTGGIWDSGGRPLHRAVRCEVLSLVLTCPGEVGHSKHGNGTCFSFLPLPPGHQSLPCVGSSTGSLSECSLLLLQLPSRSRRPGSTRAPHHKPVAVGLSPRKPPSFSNAALRAVPPALAPPSQGTCWHPTPCQQQDTLPVRMRGG